MSKKEKRRLRQPRTNARGRKDRRARREVEAAIRRGVLQIFGERYVLVRLAPIEKDRPEPKEAK
jgi:hypothetical protein